MTIKSSLVAGTTVSLVAGVAVGQHTGAHVHAAKKPMLVYHDVEPVLQGVCAQCHKGQKPAGGLDLTSYAKTMKGDRKGKVIIAGNPAKSRLATVLHGKPQLMPPGGALPRYRIEMIEAWIRAGAKAK